jgi:hypothetical protein
MSHVRVPAEAGDVVRGVAERGHDLWSVAGPDGGVIFTLGDVTDVVDGVLDRPVALDPGSQETGAGGAVVQRGDRVDDLGRGVVLRRSPASTDDLDRSGGSREQCRSTAAVQIDDLDRAELGPAVPAAAPTLPGCLTPGQAGQLPAQQRLVGLHVEQVVNRW